MPSTQGGRARRVENRLIPSQTRKRSAVSCVVELGNPIGSINTRSQSNSSWAKKVGFYLDKSRTIPFPTVHCMPSFLNRFSLIWCTISSH